MKRIIILLALLVGLITPMIVTSENNVYASTKDELQKGACLGDPACLASGSTDAESSVNNLVTTIINLFSWIVGIVAVIMVIFGGFRYITAAGDTGKTKTARDTILYALIGLVIVALAQVIVQFVITRV